MDELHIYRYLLPGGTPSLNRTPPLIHLPLQAAGDLAAQLDLRTVREERSQYVDFDLRSRRYVASPLFAGSALTVVAPDLRRPTWRLTELAWLCARAHGCSRGTRTARPRSSTGAPFSACRT